MSDNSAIQWTDATWNPTTGCTKVSPGCAQCYIERTIPFRTAKRRFVNGNIPLLLHEHRLDQPLHWREPRRIFVNSLSDLFHKDVPDQFLHQVYHTMEAAHWHQFQILTKRPERMRDYLAWRYGPRADGAGYRIPSRHIWHGVSVENQRFADERIAELVNTRAAVRFLSLEPLLEHVDLMADSHFFRNFIHWVIVGGESGPKARRCEVAWVRSIVAQCQRVGVPVFVKQLGANPIGTFDADGQTVWTIEAHGLRDKKGGDMAEWPNDLRVREFPSHR
jgi:protein gp37